MILNDGIAYIHIYIHRRGINAFSYNWPSLILYAQETATHLHFARALGRVQREMRARLPRDVDDSHYSFCLLAYRPKAIFLAILRTIIRRCCHRFKRPMSAALFFGFSHSCPMGMLYLLLLPTGLILPTSFSFSCRLTLDIALRRCMPLLPRTLPTRSRRVMPCIIAAFH